MILIICAGQGVECVPVSESKIIADTGLKTLIKDIFIFFWSKISRF